MTRTAQPHSASLARKGITAERIEFEPAVPGHERHMLLYNRLDIALDTIPFSSGTTACDALWIAVPLVTIEGDWAGGTIASSFLRAIGRPEWVASNEEEYVATVCALARNIPREKSCARRSARKSEQSSIRHGRSGPGGGRCPGADVRSMAVETTLNASGVEELERQYQQPDRKKPLGHWLAHSSFALH